MIIETRFFSWLFILSSLFFYSFQSLAQPASDKCDNENFLHIQQEYENNIEHLTFKDVPVHLCGKVITVSDARYTRSGLHGYFYLYVGKGVSIRIVNNLDEMKAQTWPWVKRGDYAEVVGRYYYDSPRRQGVDWTHKGASRKWPYPGYVIINGIKYY